LLEALVLSSRDPSPFHPAWETRFERRRLIA
jgi:hypothetical protein